MITGKEEIEIKLSYRELGYLINCTQIYHGTGKGEDLKPWMIETKEKLEKGRLKITKKNEKDNLQG